MFIQRLELLTSNLAAQLEYYQNVLQLPAEMQADSLTVQAGRTQVIFKPTPANEAAQYHFCFNIPENQFAESKVWLAARTDLLQDENGRDEFQSDSWNSNSLYFKDADGNILEFIARHDQKNASDSPFDSSQILQVSEIGLPSRDVLSFANELCATLGVSVYRQEAGETFTPIGDEEGLFILVAENRIWYPNSGVPARLLDIKLDVEVHGVKYNLSAMPYEVRVSVQP
jgi:catechol 2,3-dioxygenase-like lactoylglutathione lyase family enzyme